MAGIPALMLALKAFTAFWALVTLAVSAAFVARFNDRFGMHAVMETNFTSGNAIIAASVFTLVYLVAALVFLFRFPTSILISVMMDTIIFGFLFIFSLGSAAGLSSVASFLSDCSAFADCQLGSATLGLSWVLTFLLLGIFVFEVSWTLLKFGGSWPTWRTPFAQLLQHGEPTHTSGGIASGNAPPPVPMGSVSGPQNQYATGGPTFQGHPAQQYGAPQQHDVPGQPQMAQEGGFAPSSQSHQPSPAGQQSLNQQQFYSQSNGAPTPPPHQGFNTAVSPTQQGEISPQGYEGSTAGSIRPLPIIPGTTGEHGQRQGSPAPQGYPAEKLNALV